MVIRAKIHARVNFPLYVIFSLGQPTYCVFLTVHLSFSFATSKAFLNTCSVLAAPLQGKVAVLVQGQQFLLRSIEVILLIRFSVISYSAFYSVQKLRTCGKTLQSLAPTLSWMQLWDALQWQANNCIRTVVPAIQYNTHIVADCIYAYNILTTTVTASLQLQVCNCKYATISSLFITSSAAASSLDYGLSTPYT